MPNVPRVGTLQVDQDLGFQRWEWRAQRIGWAVMGVVLLLALLGVFGRGPASSGEAAAPDGSVRVQYDRFVHYHSPETLRLTVAGGLAEGGEVRVWVAREYLDAVEVHRVTPEPVREEAGPDGQVFVFRAADPARPVEVTFHLEPDRRGSIRGRVGLAGREPAAFDQFAYP